MRLSFHNTCVPSVIVENSLACSLTRYVETDLNVVAATHITSMILCTARFLCVTYAEICARPLAKAMAGLEIKGKI